MRLSWLLLFGLMGCADPRLPDQLVEGRHVRYHYWSDMGAPCPEAIEEIDRFIDLLGAKVNRPPPAGFRVDYYRVRDLEAVRELCIPRAAACAIENKVYSTEWTHDHEVVHAFLNHLETPPLVFLEGAAVVFGCGPARWSGAPLTPVDLEPLVDNDDWSRVLNERNYAAAGAFTRWLVDRHGLDAFVRFYERTPNQSSRAKVDAQFRAAFGEELSNALAEWHASPVSHDGEFCLPVEDACDGAPELQVTAPATSATVTAPVTCVNRVSLLEVGNVPMTRLRYSASQSHRVFRLRPCDASSVAFRALFTGTMDGRWIDTWSTLEPGRYSITVEATQDAFPRDVRSPPGGTASIEAEGHGPVLGDSCAVEAITVPDDTWALRISIASAASDDAGVMRFEPASDRRIAGFYGSGFGAAALCTGCMSPPGACLQLNPGEPYHPFLRGPMSLRLERGDDAGVVSVQLSLDPPP